MTVTGKDETSIASGVVMEWRDLQKLQFARSARAQKRPLPWPLGLESTRQPSGLPATALLGNGCEVVPFTSNESRGGANRQDERDHRLHLLPPFWPGDSDTPGSPSYQGWQQTFEPLVHPESLLDASSEYVHRGPVDFDRARLEGVRGSPREPVGPLAKNPTYAGVGRRIADIETRRKEARMKRIIEGFVFIAIAALLVCAVLWWVKPAHVCENNSMFYNLSRECPK